MNGAKIYHSKFGNLELRHTLFPRSSIQATSIVQFQLKILSLLRRQTVMKLRIC